MSSERFVWLAPSGAEVEIPWEMLEVLARLEKHIPGCKALWWRRSGEGRRKP